MSKGLTPKQEQFAEQYLLDLNATQAAIRAGYAEGSAHVTGHNLLSNTKVAERVAELQEERSRRTTIDADWLLEHLAEEATANIQDLYDKKGKLLPIKDWPEVWCKGLITEYDGKKIKVSDRVKRLELIGKHINVGAFEEKTKHTGEFVVVTRDYSKHGEWKKEADSE